MALDSSMKRQWQEKDTVNLQTPLRHQTGQSLKFPMISSYLILGI